MPRVQPSLYAGSGLTYPRRASLAPGEVDVLTYLVEVGGHPLNVVGARIVGDRGVGGGRGRGSSSETWTVHSAVRDQRGA